NLIRNEHNLGYSAANNQAIRRSRGRYILLLNSDTVVLDNSFDLAVNYMDLVPDTGVLGCKLVDQHGDWQPTISPFLTI
ncbi:MAG: glycosyltransferase, partial [Anaerolineae bacterium]|nr:glycosyltransferase [Anaerolineae bacterium]NIN94248.1 glycosyltransferase [Anaerolineae bacterium]